MKTSPILTSLLCGGASAVSVTAAATTSSSASPVKTPSCNADNCARAVGGTVLGAATLLARKADCSSLLACTAYPATSTATVTATVYPVTQYATIYPTTITSYTTYTTLVSTVTTVTDLETQVQLSTDREQVTQTFTVQATNLANLNKRISDAATTTSPPASYSTVCPTSVPTYASACSGSVRLSSACACLGVSKTLTTASSTPTTTVTVTSTGQATVTVTATSVVTSGIAAVTGVSAFTTIVTTVNNVVTEVDTVTATATQLSVCSSVPPANLIQNPNFDSNYQDLQTDSPWTLIGAASFQQDSTAQSPSAYVLTNPVMGIPGGAVSQVVSGLDPAATYTVSFYFNLRAFFLNPLLGGQQSCAIVASLGDTAIWTRAFTNPTAPAAITAGWTNVQVSRVAVSQTSAPLTLAYKCPPRSVAGAIMALAFDTVSLVSEAPSPVCSSA